MVGQRQRIGVAAIGGFQIIAAAEEIFCEPIALLQQANLWSAPLIKRRGGSV